MELLIDDIIEYFNIKDVFVEAILGMNSEMNYFEYSQVDYFWKGKMATKDAGTGMFVSAFYYLDKDVKVRLIIDPFDSVSDIKDYLTKI